VGRIKSFSSSPLRFYPPTPWRPRPSTRDVPSGGRHKYQARLGEKGVLSYFERFERNNDAHMSCEFTCRSSHTHCVCTPQTRPTEPPRERTT
jgi:hypothetical protein